MGNTPQQGDEAPKQPTSPQMGQEAKIVTQTGDEIVVQVKATINGERPQVIFTDWASI